jgi:hypothetical protein
MMAAHLLGGILPTPVRSYGVEWLLSDGGSGSYDDYLAHHQALGHNVLFRHERWLSPEVTRSRDTTVVRTIGHALEGLRRARRLQAELQHPRILPVMDFFEEDGEWFSVFGIQWRLSRRVALSVYRAHRVPRCGRLPALKGCSHPCRSRRGPRSWCSPPHSPLASSGLLARRSRSSR